MTDNQTQAKAPRINLDLRLLQVLAACAQAHVEDIESGLEDGMYSQADNTDLGAKREALDAAFNLLKDAVPPAAQSSTQQAGSIPRVVSLAEIKAMADQAANEAVACIQAQLNQSDGGFAAVYFSGGAWEVLTDILEGYIRAEISHQLA